MPMPQAAPFSVYFWSIASLRWSMIAWRVHRTIKGAMIRVLDAAGLSERLFRERPGAVACRPAPPLSSTYTCERIDLAGSRFSFLQDARTLPADRSDRRAAVASTPLLWQFHYHYHDYLLALLQQESADRAGIRAFLERWMDDHPLAAPGSRTSAWHPYVLSIRIEAWIRLHGAFALSGDADDADFAARLARGIEQMTRVLLRNLERGTMANHFLKNIKALVLAGLFLETRTGSTALRRGMRHLHAELAEQVLADGMHFERSPMYHAAMTSDVLDLREALQRSPLGVPSRLAGASAAMTAFLARCLHPDGEIPFFNDATRSFFLSTRHVLERGVTLCGGDALRDADAAAASASRAIASRISGLLISRSPALFVILDAGEIGPDYQPGHAHCDTLSYEISWNGARVISDTGVSHYRESPERMYARSTAAHNTLRIDGADQSEVWKSFRVGRRAHIIYSAQEHEQGCVILRGAHDGYTRIDRGLIHERAMVIRPDEWICVIDFIHGAGRRMVENIVHLHPGLAVHPDGPRTASARAATRTFRITGLRDEGRHLYTTDYYPAFGVRADRRTLVFHTTVQCPYATGYVIAFASAPEPHVAFDGMSARIAFGASSIMVEPRA